MASKTTISPNFSFSGWNIWEFIKGRKKMIITALASGLAYIGFGLEPIALITGPIFEAIWSVVEYFLKKVDNKKEKNWQWWRISATPRSTPLPRLLTLPLCFFFYT